MGIPTLILKWEARTFPLIVVLKKLGGLDGAVVTLLIIGK
jgi:hypothetical protein